MRVIQSLLASGRHAVFVDARLNLRVLAGTALVAIAAGVIFGLAPALRATRVDLSSALKAGPEAGTRRPRSRGGRSLVVAQVALCVLLVTTAGLLVGTLRNLRAVEPGFDRSNLVMFNVETYDPSFTSEERALFYDRLLVELQQIPGVTSVALAKRTPVDLGTERRRFEIRGVPPRAGQEGVSSNVVTPEFFRLFGIRLLRGREFTAADRAGRENVAIISQAAARVYFGDADPIGRTARLGGAKQPVTIVGLVTDVRHEGLRESPPPMLYLPLAQPEEALDGSVGYPGTSPRSCVRPETPSASRPRDSAS